VNEDTTDTMIPPTGKQMTARRENQIMRAMLFARRQTMREVLSQIATQRALGGNLSALNDWAAGKERVQSRGLEQSRTGDGSIPEELREAPIDADAREMVEAMRGVGHSVVVEHEGKRAIFTVTGRYLMNGHTITLEPQVDP
jgi:hypothetical protein